MQLLTFKPPQNVSVVNIIKNQNPFPVWDLSIKEMESSFSAGYQVNSAILVK